MEEIISLNSQKIYLSSNRRVFKTEGFVFLTRKMPSIDEFVSRLAEALFYFNPALQENECYTVETADKLYTLFFTLPKPRNELKRGDIVFYKLVSAQTDHSGVDRTLSEYLLAREFNLTLRSSSDKAPQSELLRLYLVTGGEFGVSFPLLNTAQRKIVETENANMLVQGVAGSGKTNVCVEKIVYCACRNYRGKVLYTTFSRGLLFETQKRVSLFTKSIDNFVQAYENGNVVFLDDNHKKAVENKLGVLFDTDDDAKIAAALKNISHFLKNNVDYFLIEDIYAGFFDKIPVASESVFLNDYLGNKNNYRLSGALEKIKNIAPEIIYKEIYGMIFGKYELNSPQEMMTRDEYAEARRESFSRAECDVIYSVAADYAVFLQKKNLTDNNLMSRKLLAVVDEPVYSVGIIDEVQDFTQVNLCLIKKLCRKMFCVGDALQMINPSYFSFGYLKRLMYGDVTGVTELTNNYRSTEKIESIAEKLGELNTRYFGTHSFVLKGESVSSDLQSETVFVREKGFSEGLADKRLESVTVVVSSQRKKAELRKLLAKTEILTVAEAKGLERQTVVLLDVLSDNADKWSYLDAVTLNRKTADENSVFRYYFNLFYVGISRAKQFLFVFESNCPPLFKELFESLFSEKNKNDALKSLIDVAGKTELDDEELAERIAKFCELEQYENAVFAANRMYSDELRNEQLAHIFVHQNFLRYNRYRDAGVEYWRRGMDFDARKMFTLSGDEKLFPLMDACKDGSGALDVETVKFFPLVSDNELAKKLILETVEKERKALESSIKQCGDIFKKGKRK